MRFNGIDIAAMFPYKVVSKKSAKLSNGPLVSNSSVFLPAATKEEYTCQSQLSVMVELLLNNKQTIIDRIEGDLEDTSKPCFSEFPSILRILQENNLLHFYLKDYHASVVDEYDELMSNVPGLWSHRDLPFSQEFLPALEESDEDEIHSVCFESSASVESYDNVLDNEIGPELLVHRNNKFLGLPIDTHHAPFRGNPEGHLEAVRQLKLCSRNLLQWVEDNSEEKNSLFDSDYLLLTSYSLLDSPYEVYTRMFSNVVPQQAERSKPHKKSKEFFIEAKGTETVKEHSVASVSESSLVPSRKTSQYDYSYYEYRIEKASAEEQESSFVSANNVTLPESSTKQSRDEHHEVEVSTKSEELPEEIPEQQVEKEADTQPAIEETKQLSKAAKKKMKKIKKKAQNLVIAAAEVESPSPQRVTKSRKSEDAMSDCPKQPPVVERSVKPIEPAYFHSDSFSYEPEREKLKQKELERLKQDSKDYLKDLFAKIPEADDLDEFEKDAVNQINSLDSLTKKMKQKARRRLRQEIDDEKAQRKLLEEKQMEEEQEEDFEDERRSIFEEFQNRYRDILLPDTLSKELFRDRPNLELIKNFCKRC